MRVMILGMLSFVLSGGAAHADMLLVNKNVMVTAPSVPIAETLTLTSAGTLTMTVTDLAWPQALAALSFAITDSTHALLTADAAGSLIYQVTSPMTLFANVFATPNAASNAGLYHLSVSFAPVVPLPAAVWLLFSGLFGVGFTCRKHATVTNSVVQ